MIEVSDTGPGVPEKARTHLFQAFQGSARAGGTGLGRAMLAELVRAHAVRFALCRHDRATFSITIPDRAVDLDTPTRRARTRLTDADACRAASLANNGSRR